MIRNLHKEDAKIEALVEDILHDIADLETSKKNTNKKVYILKESHRNRINPFFYFYNRPQRDEVDAEFTEKNEVFNKPPYENMPTLKPLFKGTYISRNRDQWNKPSFDLIFFSKPRNTTTSIF